MDARSFPAELALRMFEVDNRRTEVGRAVTKALADVNPRLADIAIHGGPLLPGETRESLIAEAVVVLRPLAWARPELVAAAVMKPLGRFDGYVGCWMLHFSESDEAFDLMAGAHSATEQLKTVSNVVKRGALQRCVADNNSRRKGMIRKEAAQHWQRLLDEVQAAWDAQGPGMRS